jgi:hypothetical protein
MATQRWYYTPNGKKKLGPFSSAQIKTLAASGKIQPDDMLLQEGSARWMAARSVKGLFPARESIVPPPRPVWPLAAFGGGVVLVTALIVMAILVFGGKRDAGEQQVASVDAGKKQDTKRPAPPDSNEPAPQVKEGEPSNPPLVSEKAPEKAPATVPEKAAEKVPPETPEKPTPPEPPVQEKQPEKETARAFDPEPAQEAAEAALAAVRQYWDELSPGSAKEANEFTKGLVRTLLETARMQLAEMKYDDAKVSAEQALKLIPRHPEAMRLLAQIEKARPAPKEPEPEKSEEPKQEDTSPKVGSSKGDEKPPRTDLEELLLLGYQSLLAENVDLAAEVFRAAAAAAPKSAEVLAALAELEKARREGDADYVRLQNDYARNMKAGAASFANAQKQAQAVKAAQLYRSAVGLFRAAVGTARDLAADYPETAEQLLAAEAEVKTALKAQQQADLVVRVQGLVKEVQNLTGKRKLKDAIKKFKEAQKLAPEDQGVATAGQELERAIKEGPGVALAVPATAVLRPNSKLLLSIKLIRQNGGFRGPINVGLQGLPNGVTAKGVTSSADYVTLSAGQNEAQFQLSADVSVQPGAYRVGALGRLPDEQIGAEFKLIVLSPKR